MKRFEEYEEWSDEFNDFTTGKVLVTACDVCDTIDAQMYHDYDTGEDLCEDCMLKSLLEYINDNFTCNEIIEMLKLNIMEVKDDYEYV